MILIPGVLVLFGAWKARRSRVTDKLVPLE
jgi:hypothetical protein